MGGDLSLVDRIRIAILKAVPSIDVNSAGTFAIEHAGDSANELTSALTIFIQKGNGLPKIPPITQGGWKFHFHEPLRTFCENDEIERHARVAEGAILASVDDVNFVAVSAVAANIRLHAIDLIKNDTLHSNFSAMKDTLATNGKDPAERLLFHGTQEANLVSLLSFNFDPTRIKRVLHGPGFYFSEFPDFCLPYGNSLILCRVLPGRSQTEGTYFNPNSFDSFQVVETGKADVEGDPHYKHVISNADQILPFCIVHTSPPRWNHLESPQFTLHRTVDLCYFDEDNATEMQARLAHSFVYRMISRQKVSSVIYLENADAKTMFLEMKRQFATSGRDTREVLLFHHFTSLSPTFFSANEFDVRWGLSESSGPDFQLTDWVQCGNAYVNIYVVYRVLLGNLQAFGPRLDPTQFDSFRVMSMGDSNRSRYTYVIRNSNQVLPYCVAVFKNEWSKIATIENIVRELGPYLTHKQDTSEELVTDHPRCRVCRRANMNLQERYGCASSCALCADFFRRTCIGSKVFVQPPACASYSCVDLLKCASCRLKQCLDAGMSAAALLCDAGMQEEAAAADREAELTCELDAFQARVLSVRINFHEDADP